MYDSLKLSAVFIVVLLLFVTNFKVDCLAQNQTISSVDDLAKKEAEKLWELAIAAKGGRERLESISNMLVTGEVPIYYIRLLPFRTKDKPKHTRLYVFPDKYWEWSDSRPSIFGLRISMRDYNNNTYYTGPNYVDEDGLQPLAVEKDGKVWGRKRDLEMPQVTNFMETKWVKPIPIKVSQGYLHKKWVKLIENDGKKNRKNLVDILQTRIWGERVDFVLDHKSHLPIRIGFLCAGKRRPTRMKS